MTRVALISCVKSKLATASQAGDLYTSTMFRLMRRYAETHSDAWFILSAEHGLLAPETVINPYEKTLNKMPKAERLAWAAKVRAQLTDRLEPGTQVVMLAGERYREGLLPYLKQRGLAVEIPMYGLRMGEQLQWLSRSN